MKEKKKQEETEQEAEEMDQVEEYYSKGEIITSVYHLPELTEEEKREVEEQRKKLAALTDEEWLDLVYPNRKRDKGK